MPHRSHVAFGLGPSGPAAAFNIEAEQAVLGALLANNNAHKHIAGFLAPEHFGVPCHGDLYAAIVRRIEAGQLADAVTLKAELARSGALDEVGGTAYLARLLSRMVGIINAREYGRVIYEAWLDRQLDRLWPLPSDALAAVRAISDDYARADALVTLARRFNFEITHQTAVALAARLSDPAAEESGLPDERPMSDLEGSLDLFLASRRITSPRARRELIRKIAPLIEEAIRPESAVARIPDGS